MVDNQKPTFETYFFYQPWNPVRKKVILKEKKSPTNAIREKKNKQSNKQTNKVSRWT